MKEDDSFDEDGQPRKRKRVKLYDEDLPIQTQRENANTPEHTPEPDKLSKIQERFVWRYTNHYDPIRAAIEAGVSPSRAKRTSRLWLNSDVVKEHLDGIHSDRLRRMQINGDEFIARDLALASADFTQIAKMHIPPCRHCWGTNHLYQRTHAEFEKDFEDHNQGRGGTKEVKGRLGLNKVVNVPFDPKGGSGYNISEDPNPACPNCFGHGQFIVDCETGAVTGNQPVVIHKSLEHLPPELRQAINGVKIKNGTVEISLRDRDAAMNRLHALFKTSAELGFEPGGGKTMTLRPDGKGGYGGNGPRQITSVRRVVVDPAPEPGDTDRESVSAAPGVEEV